MTDREWLDFVKARKEQDERQRQAARWLEENKRIL